MSKEQILMVRGYVNSFQLIWLILFQILMFSISPVFACDYNQEPHNVLKIYDNDGTRKIEKRLGYTGIGGSCEITNMLFGLEDNSFYIQDNVEELNKYSITNGELIKENSQNLLDSSPLDYFYVNDDFGMSYEETWSYSDPDVQEPEFNIEISVHKFDTNDLLILNFNLTDLFISTIGNETYNYLTRNVYYIGSAFVDASGEFILVGFEMTIEDYSKFYWLYRYSLFTGNSTSVYFLGDHDPLRGKNTILSPDGRYAIILVEYSEGLFYLVNFLRQDAETVLLPGRTTWEYSDVIGHDLYFMLSDSDKIIRKVNLEDATLTDVGDFGITGRFVVLNDYFLFIETDFDEGFIIFGFGFYLATLSCIFLTILTRKRKK